MHAARVMPARFKPRMNRSWLRKRHKPSAATRGKWAGFIVVPCTPVANVVRITPTHSGNHEVQRVRVRSSMHTYGCLLYTSDAADE